MSLLKKLAGLAVGAAAVGAVAYVLNKRDQGEEYEHIVGPEDEADAEAAEPEADVPGEAVQEAPAAAPQPPVARTPPPRLTPPTSTRRTGAVEAPKTADGRSTPPKSRIPPILAIGTNRAAAGKLPRKTRRIFVFCRQRCAFLFPKMRRGRFTTLLRKKYNTNR